MNQACIAFEGAGGDGLPANETTVSGIFSSLMKGQSNDACGMVATSLQEGSW